MSLFKLKAVSILFFILSTLKMQAQCPKLVWSDEFGGTALDLTKWTYQTGAGCSGNVCGWGNNELEWYTESNTNVSNGTLKIIAKKETVQGLEYTSSRIRTINKGDIKYGRIEARMKMPVGKGLWPAFWMMPTDNVYGVWPLSGEIDIMEFLGDERAKVYGTIHFGRLWPNNLFSGNDFSIKEGGLNDDFHEYALEWSENQIRWFVDGYLYSTKTPEDLKGSPWIFDQKFHFILNLAVGGNWPGKPYTTTVFPQTFEIDYVRVYDLVGAPFLTGKQVVVSKAQNSVYSLSNVPTGSTIAWKLPDGTTIVSGNGTKDITVNWGVKGGKIVATVTTPCGETKHELIVLVEPGLATEVVLENFDLEAKITRTQGSGVFTDNFANPAPNVVNSSALCGKYVRNGAQQYDALFYDIAAINDGSVFTTGEKKFYIDINTNAPIGSSILLQLENKAQSLPANYPTGRHSRYTAVTTKQNEWERLTFAFTDKPDGSVSNSSISQMVVLFAPNTFTGSTFHFDNLEIYAKSATPTPTLDIETKYPIQLSPNPVSDYLYLKAEQDKIIEQISLVDASGRRVLQQSNIHQSDAKINVQTLVAGVYFINVQFTDAVQVTKKFVKQ
jgi:beta-glucanase (GH16 family)